MRRGDQHGRLARSESAQAHRTARRAAQGDGGATEGRRIPRAQIEREVARNGDTPHLLEKKGRTCQVRPRCQEMGSVPNSYFPFALASSIATAGSVFPSTNSRNAPPPVEIYEMPSSTPYFSIAASVSPPPASENAGDFATACAMAFVPSPN